MFIVSHRRFFLHATIWLSILLQACATSADLRLARDQFKYGNTDAALQTLADADVSKRDQLLLHLDSALVAQAATRFKDSIEAFERALALIDSLDYISARDQTAAVLSNDWAIRYSGELSERLWIHTFQMINYLMLDAPQSAAVEARRAVALYDKNNDVLENDLFTRYLMALSFETAGQRDSAGVEYRKLAKDFDIQPVQRLAANTGELVLLVATGFIEPKLPGDLLIDLDMRVSFPYYPESYDSPPSISIQQNQKTLKPARVDTTLLSVARSALAKRGKSVAARQALRLAAKYNIADKIGDEDPLAGGVAKLFLLAIEQADTRSWETLPAFLSLVRVPVPAGQSSLSVSVDNFGSWAGGRDERKIELDIKPGERKFQILRVGIDNKSQL